MVTRKNLSHEQYSPKPGPLSSQAPIWDAAKGTLLLPVSHALFYVNGVDKRAQREGFQKKDEFHITIIGFQNGKKIQEILGGFSPQAQEHMTAQIHSLVEKTDWSFALKPEYYFVDKDYFILDADDEGGQIRERREAYIQMASLASLQSFYATLNSILGSNLAAPPVHVTLYTKGDGGEKSKMGIGIESQEELRTLRPQLVKLVEQSIQSTRTMNMNIYQKIMLPTRPQPDTIVAIFLLRIFGKHKYPGVETAPVDILSDLPQGETADSLTKQGLFLVDVGGSPFDHHGRGTTASRLIAEDLGIADSPALLKLLSYAERDDKYGRGTISQDPLDKAFGLSGLISALNKALPADPGKVVEYVLPLLKAHYAEERKRTIDLPKEFEERLRDGSAEVAQVRHKGKNIKIVALESDSPSMTGWLRSVDGAKADVVLQKTGSGYVNLTTRPIKKIDLRWTAALLRSEEADVRNREMKLSAVALMKTGRLEEVPEWYYDRATNSLLNGGIIPKGVLPTAISFEMVKELTKEGLAVPIEKKGRVTYSA